MGRPIEVTDEAIIEAGNRILADNKIVNGDRIRQYIGIGLPRQMAKVWRDHLAANEVAVVTPPLLDLPGPIAEQRDVMHKQVATLVDSLAAGAWKAADELARQRSRAEHDEARRRIAEFEDEQEVAGINLQAADAKLDDAMVQMERITGQAVAANLEVVRLQERLDAAIGEAQRAGQAAAAEAGRLRAELAEVRSDLDASRKDHSTVSAELATAVARLAAASADAAREREARERAEETMADMIQRTAAKAPNTRAPRKGRQPQADTSA